MHRTTEIRREITVPGAFISAERLTARHWEQNWLCGEARGLSVVRGVVSKAIASLLSDDVEHRTLDVAIFGRRSHALDLHFLNDVNAWFGARYALARTGEVRTVDEKQILADARAEGGHGVDCPTCRRGWRHTGSGPDQIEHAVPPRGNRSEVLWSEASFKTAVSGFGARAGCLDDNRFRHACHLQHDCPLQSGARADRDVFLVIGRKSRHLDVEPVGPGSQIRESELPCFARRHGPRPANQCLGGDTNLPPRNHGPLFIPNRSNESSCQTLRRSHPRQQNACGDQDHYE